MRSRLKDIQRGELIRKLLYGMMAKEEMDGWMDEWLDGWIDKWMVG